MKPNLPCVAAIAIQLLPVAAAEEPSVGLTFEKNIRPIFRVHCYDCHGATDDISGGLDLRLVHRMTSGGESGPAIVPGSPDESYLVQRLRDGEMPPGPSGLAEKDIATIER